MIHRTDSIVSWVEAQGSYRSCTFTQRKCLIKSESVCLSVWCAWEKKIRSVWLFYIVFVFTARPPPLDLRGLSTISECPFHGPLTRTMTEPRWELWQTHIYTPKWPQTLFFFSATSVCVLHLQQRHCVCFDTALPQVTWSLFPAFAALPAQMSSHLLVCDVYERHTDVMLFVNCKIFVYWKLLCFVSVCLFLAHHFSLFLWTGGGYGA